MELSKGGFKMTVDEMKQAISQLKADGHNDDEILGAFYKMFQDDKLDLEQLEGVVNLMGYHLKDEFKAMSPEDQKTKGYEKVDEPAEGVSNEQVEEAKEEEPEEKPAEEKPEEKPEGDESDEEKRAMKLFEGKK